jgi:L-fuconolactonase
MPAPAKFVVDSHQHFWNYDPVQHSWINDEMAAIRRDFSPEDLQPVYKDAGVAACVAVQADQTEAETLFLTDLAAKHSFIRGVVGWVDLRDEALDNRLAFFAQHPVIKGFRHVLQGEEPAFMLQESFLRGISMLSEFGFTYDILIFPQHLPAALQLVRKFPDQPFVIDHIAKPYIKTGELGAWETGIRRLAEHPNVHCKVSGMVTEADMRNWKEADFRPYLDVVTESFGSGRLMYGSDWPVCLSAASYQQVITIVQQYYSQFSADEQAAIMGGNAVAFYQLNL